MMCFTGLLCIQSSDVDASDVLRKLCTQTEVSGTLVLGG